MTTTTRGRVSRVVSTAEPRGNRANPGERDHVLGYLQRANASAASRATREILPPSALPGCAECRSPKVRTDGAGNRVVYPCSSCGAVRG